MFWPHIAFWSMHKRFSFLSLILYCLIFLFLVIKLKTKHFDIHYFWFNLQNFTSELLKSSLYTLVTSM